MSDFSNPKPGTGQIRSLSGQRQQSPAPAAPPPMQDLLEEDNEWSPPPLTALEDTGLNLLAVADLILKVLYFGGYMTGFAVCEIIKLPFTGVAEKAFTFLKREKFIEVQAGGGYNEASYQYLITQKGSEKAREAMERSQYAGPAPVPVSQYVEAIRMQNRKKISVRRRDLRRVMENLVISDEMLDKIGPAVNGGRSIFLYGPPGNGKTTIAEKVGRIVLGDDMWIPYAFDVDGQIVQVYDGINHELAPVQEKVKHATGVVADQRWVRIKRPMIMVGGELTLEGLDLVYDPINKFYEAPFQVKANGGMFLIDDFGRQQVRPQDLLNRWIVPLEKAVDFLTLNNGRKIEMPFFVMIVFSTNLEPKHLVDDAFLRRIRYKIEVGNPSADQFREIFKIMCRIKGVPYDDQGLAYLLKEWYLNKEKEGRFRDMRMVHPRDLISQLLDIAAYLEVSPTLSKDLLDRAAASYFVKLS
ncbi:MAG: ATP-binding protein [Chloroflexi bacterium]|nr:ATP-binding protein [Chloroflexota bacterium]